MPDSDTLERPAAADTISFFTAAQLAERATYRRAVEAVIWGMPAVNFDLMLQSFIRAGGGPNQVPFWSRLLDSHNQTLTPNPDTIYFNPFFDTKLAGPMVLEIPPADGGSITGSIDDCWQNALEDVGPAGVDKGAGGKYLILPPDQRDAVPEGYIAVPCDTYQGFVILRSNVKSGNDEDVSTAVDYGKRIRFYPLSQATNPPETRFVDLAGVNYDGTIHYDASFFRSLARMVDHEPWLTRDKAMIDPLRWLGISKGKLFEPAPEVEKQLDEAAREAHAFLDLHYEDVFDPPFYPGGRWALPANPEVAEGLPTFFSAPDAYPTDGRGVTYSMAYFSAKHIGAGQYYLMSIRDRAGNPFEGDATYRLHVPPDAPIRLYWSATAYDRETHALIREVPRASRASNSPGLKANPDGSVDLWFASKSPEGNEGNWVPTRAGRGFEVLFRIYGPEKAFFDKSWVLPDIEKV
ncbi:MAG TPA: DUF1254 domain-containing protein [Sphingomicrobium sp.]|nr:DUF1254 domain-containing protein [Sphingomicrobium sp.]